MQLKRLLCGMAALALAFAVGTPPASAADVPAPGQSKTVDAIKERGVLRAAAIAGFPWLVENTSGSGPQYSGPAWLLAEEFARQLDVQVEIVPVSHETKVPIIAAGQADISIAPLGVNEARLQVVDFVVYSKFSTCYFGRADNPKLADVDVPEDMLDRDDLTFAYFTGSAQEPFLPKRFPKATMRAVAGSGELAPIEEIMSRRADVATVDAIAHVKLVKAIPGLKFVPSAGDACLASTEQQAPVGLAVGKDDAVFLEWLRAVQSEMQLQLDAEERRHIEAQS
jgi:polar amino acid transport system substrate-binding protein